MNIKKIVILLAVVLSLVLLLGSFGPSQQIYDPNLPNDPRPDTISRVRILKYEVVVASGPNDLETEVTRRLKGKDNWMLIGGVSSGNGKYHQAMAIVKE
jgi:hypothetical protein